MDLNKTMGHQLKVFRVSLDLTQEELASALGVCPMTVSNMERGNNSVSTKIQAKLQETFKANPGFFFGNTDQRFLEGVSSDEVKGIAIQFKRRAA